MEKPLYKIEFDKQPWESPSPGVRSKIFEGDGKKIRLVEYTSQMEPHWCTKSHIAYMLAGTLEIKINKKTIVYNPGDILFLPAGEKFKHKAKIQTDAVRILFIEDSQD